MKAIFALLILTIGMVFSMPAYSVADPPGKQQTMVIDQQHLAPVVMAQDEGGVQVIDSAGDINDTNEGAVLTANESKPIGALLLENWFELAMAFLGLWEVIVRITPTQKDNSILNWLVDLLNMFNYKKGGGTFRVRSNI